jgi:hypothetical protein
MNASAQSGSAPHLTAGFLARAEKRSGELERHAQFYSEYPAFSGQLPHHNACNGSNLLDLEVTCDDCDCLLPLEIVHGVINDYVHCTEVRYVGNCPRCERVMHNVLRVTGDEIRYIKDGAWCVSTRRPWWHCLWPWPVDREW